MGPTIYPGGPTLSREHKRPLFAFVAVSVLCVLMLGHAIRSDAVLGLLLPSPGTVAAAPVVDTAAPARTVALVEGPQIDPAVRQVPAAAPKPRSKAKTRIGRSVMSSPVAVAAPAQVTALVPAPVVVVTAPLAVPAPQPQPAGGRKAQDTEKAAKQAATAQKQAERRDNQAAKRAAKAQKQAAKQVAKAQKQAAKQAEEKSGGAKKGHAGTFTTRKAVKRAEKSQAQAEKKTEDAAGEPGPGNGKPTGEATHGSAPGQQG